MNVSSTKLNCFVALHMYAPIAIKSIPESIKRRLKNYFSQYKHLFGSAIYFMDIYVEINSLYKIIFNFLHIYKCFSEAIFQI